MSSASSKPAGYRAPKIGHKKSMFGCQRCRARRVKCNEAKPSCHHCQRHRTPCVYDRDTSAGTGTPSPTPPQHPHPHPHPPPPPPEISLPELNDTIPRQDPTPFPGGSDKDAADPPEGRSRRLLEAKLMLQYVTETSNATGVDDISRKVFGEMVPRMAFDSDALLYSMYTSAAFQLAALGREPQLNPAEVSRQYMSMAIREHNKELAQVTRDNIDILCMTSSILRNCATVMLQGRCLEPYAPPLEFLHMSRSSTILFEEAWRIAGSNPNSIAAQYIIITRDLHHEPSMPAQNDPERLEHLVRRDPNTAQPEPWDPETRIAYDSALQHLNRVFDIMEADGPRNHAVRALVLFPMLVKRRFVELVEASTPRALVILAHYFALLNQHSERWWIGDAGAKEVRAIAKELQDEHWQSLLEWPLSSLEDTEMS
ncbi:hypothetical protein F4778DRAFT_375539 [Xylariomycetidae sp. FL2044]|nr:hypothetical protein F4778DRAFT_375539 [Xylariomycetidae sp. FL2044]